MRYLVSIMVMLAPLGAGAQSATVEITAGDRAYAAMDASAALTHFERAATADPRNYEALWKASRSAADIGTSQPSESKASELFAKAEQYARRAIAVNPGDPEGHFGLARALGKTALSVGPRSRVRYATEVRSVALECLKLTPAHAGCLHVMGMWNAEVMRLNSFTRLLAKNVLGGKVFGSASWDEAVKYMMAAVASEPKRIVHRVDLGGVYRDVGERGKARAEFEAALALPASDFGDSGYRAEARTALARLR